MSPHEVIDLMELNAELLAALREAENFIAANIPEVWKHRDTSPTLHQIKTAIAKAEAR